MSHPKPLSRRHGVEPEARALDPGDILTVEHDGGARQTVFFEDLGGDKLEQIRVRWPLAGFYGVDSVTGRLSGKGRKKGRSASAWKIIDEDMERIWATRSRAAAERRARLRKNKGGGS